MPPLAHLHARLSDVYNAIQSFDDPLPHPPVISHYKDKRETLPGLRLLREEVERDLDRLLRESTNSSNPSTNAPYHIAVWDELIHAHQPIAIYRMFSPANGQDKVRGKGTASHGKTALRSHPRPVKVDVVADNGARWVRVNTIKNARLMMEFREMDSYLTSDEDEDELRSRLPQTELDNSLLRMGRDLLAAAKANPALSNFVGDSNSTTYPTPNPNTTMTPQITIRLTRLDPSLEDDARIGRTIQSLRDMGIEVQLGERSFLHPTFTKHKLLEPTTNINLDLSALIALISDISHSPLPRTGEEAHARFEPSQSYLDWKRNRAKSLARQSQGINHFLYDVQDGEENEGPWENSGQHSRALVAQAIQEMSKGLLEEIHERISMVVTRPSSGVTFWTTNEARQRCLQIVSKIGGEKEKQRAGVLLSSTLCAHTLSISAPVDVCSNGVARTGGMNDGEMKMWLDGYWEHSRYPTGFLALVPVQVYPSNLPAMGAEDINGESRRSFFNALTRTCIGILSREPASVSEVSAGADGLLRTRQALEGVPPATQTSLPKLTVHTVASMLAGASRGYTTLTTNRSSVKAVLKEIERVYGRGGYEPERVDVEKAALWVVDPRSLSEGMRSKQGS